MTIFTDPIAAIEEACFIARLTFSRQAVVSAPGGMMIIPASCVTSEIVLEICQP